MDFLLITKCGELKPIRLLVELNSHKFRIPGPKIKMNLSATH